MPFVVFGLIVIVTAIYAAFETRFWLPETSTSGCLSGFQQVVHRNEHNMTDSYFRVLGHEFHLNSSPWAPGYKDNGALSDGRSVSVIHRGDHVVDIAVNGRC